MTVLLSLPANLCPSLCFWVLAVVACLPANWLEDWITGLVCWKLAHSFMWLTVQWNCKPVKKIITSWKIHQLDEKLIIFYSLGLFITWLESWFTVSTCWLARHWHTEWDVYRHIMDCCFTRGQEVKKSLFEWGPQVVSIPPLILASLPGRETNTVQLSS